MICSFFVALLFCNNEVSRMYSTRFVKLNYHYLAETHENL